MKHCNARSIARTFFSILFFAIGTTKGFGQNVGINTSGNSADPTALLEVGTGADSKGLLIPRVSLTSTTDVATISGAEANSLIVYNTNSAMTNGNGTGFYYYNTTAVKWIYIPVASNGPGNSGQVLTSQGGTVSPQWVTPTTTSSGTSGCFTCPTTWSITTAAATYTLKGCMSYCETLNEATFTDWRVPTVQEAILLFSSMGAANTPFWTSSVYEATVGACITMDPINSTWSKFGTANVFYCKCVR